MGLWSSQQSFTPLLSILGNHPSIVGYILQTSQYSCILPTGGHQAPYQSKVTSKTRLCMALWCFMVDIYQHLMNLTFKESPSFFHPGFFPFKAPIARWHLFSHLAQRRSLYSAPGALAGHRSTARQLPALAALATQGRHGLQRDAQRGHVVRRRRGRKRGPDAAV